MREGILCSVCEKSVECTRICKLEAKRRYKERHPDKFKEQRNKSKKNYRINHRKRPLIIYEWEVWLRIANPRKRVSIYDSIACKKYYNNHKESIIARVIEYNKTYSKQYYEQNKDAIQERVNQYKKTPNGKLLKKIHHRKRRSIEQGVENTLTELQWQKILYNQNNTCLKCNQQFTVDNPATEDHIIPVSNGGGRTFENIQALCRSCNSRKNKHLDKSNILTWIHIHNQQQVLQISAKPILTSGDNELV